jgi:3-dehydroquinate dehydratase-2
MLGVREPNIYGSETLKDIEMSCEAAANRLHLILSFKQSNIEGELVGWIQDARTSQDAIIINAGALTHTSIAILYAFAREEFRHHSYISQCATGVICGFGADGYELALEAAKRLLSK